MRYYVQRHGKVEGPLTVEEINSKIASGLVDSQWFATSDLGEGRDRILKAPHRDWFPVPEIPGIIGVTKMAGGYKEMISNARLAFIVLMIVIGITVLFALLAFQRMFGS